MKVAFEVWVEDDAELTNFCATAATKKDGNTAVNIINLGAKDLDGIDGYLFKSNEALPVKDGEA